MLLIEECLSACLRIFWEVKMVLRYMGVSGLRVWTSYGEGEVHCFKDWLTSVVGWVSVREVDNGILDRGFPLLASLTRTGDSLNAYL